MTGGISAQEVSGGQQLDISGELEVVVLEDFDRQRSERAYFIREDNSHRVFELKFSRRPPQHLKSGKRIGVRGRGQGRDLWVESLQEEGNTALPADTGSGDAALGTDERRAVVLMVDLNDASASTRYTLDQVAANMWTGSRSVDGLFQETSFGQLRFPPDSDGDFEPDVFGPFSINYSGTSCNYYDWAVAAESAAQAAGVDLSLYRHRVLVLPRHNDLPGCSWSGIANVGCGSFCRAWIAEGESPMVFAHELGHNLNLAHAGTDPENDGQKNSTYGDYSDPMGLSRRWHRFNGAHVDQLGWYETYAGSVTTVLVDGIYDIAAIGLDPELTGIPHILKIEKPDSGEFYYLSYRQPSGYDDSLSATYTQGINVHRYSGNGYGYTYFITALNDLENFDDVPNGITISQLAHNTDYATVAISFDGGGNGGACTSADPAVSIAPANLQVQSGALVNYTVELTNHDSNDCAGTNFDLLYSGEPSGSLSTFSLTLAPGEAVSADLEIDTLGLVDGEYLVQVQASDGDGLEPHHQNPVVGFATIVVDTTPPEAATGLSGAVDKKGKVSLSWQPATDALSGVESYSVYRDGSLIGQTSGTSHQDSNTTAGATYGYTVVTIDGVGYQSAPSNALQLTVSNSSGKGGGGSNGGGKGRKAK
jgi:hypothetical protein